VTPDIRAYTWTYTARSQTSNSAYAGGAAACPAEIVPADGRLRITLHAMSDDSDDLSASFAMWGGGMTGTDGEFILRAGSILELGTGLHHLAVMADRYVADHDQQSATDIAGSSRSAQAVAPEVRERVAREFGPLADALKQRLGDQLDRLDPDALPSISDPFEWVAGQMAEPMRASLAGAQGLLSGVPADDDALGPYLLQYSQAVEREPLLPTMRRALLITAVASAETMLIGILRRLQYNCGGDERWGSLVSSPSLDRAMRELTRGSIHDWVPRVRAALDVDLPAATPDWDSVREIWARRHVLVHNRGVTDAKYVARVPRATAGTMLCVDGDYLSTAIDLLCGFLLAIILLAWAARPRRHAFAVQYAAMYAAGAETELRWPLAESLHHAAARIDPDTVMAAAHQVNAWLARTRRAGPDSVIDAVRAWPTDELPPRFRLARTILLDERDTAISMLPGALLRGDVTRSDLRTWPLFDRLRGTAEFDRLALSDAEPQDTDQ
jgi:hypothetical protein